MLDLNKITLPIILLLPLVFLSSQDNEEYEYIDEDSCIDCHEESAYGTDIELDVSKSIHNDLGCLDCHTDKDTDPHRENIDFVVGGEGCRTCHNDASEQYQAHGVALIGAYDDMPHCSDCHGDHNVLPSDDRNSIAHPTNLPSTCGKCHENIDLTTKYDILIDHPVEIYETSVHGQASMGGIYVAATCNDCHSTGETAHKIYSPGHSESTINHFNIPKTCGKCHKGVEKDYWDGIHGQLAARGETDAPVCTHCHGEHGIISPDDPRSPVSKSKVAEMTCSPCHDSARMSEKYGLSAARLQTFVDSYHGLKSKSGDTHVANCASCHGVHRILPSEDEASSIHPSNLKQTCGDCHPKISDRLAATPIHGIDSEGLQTPVADIIEKIYIIAIIIIIGFMIIHWIIDLIRQIVNSMKKQQVRRMRTHEVWQHTLIMLSFIALAISGFALRFSDAWITDFFFGWARGFEMRGLIHRISAVVFIITVLWHLIFILFRPRGKTFIKDMWPKLIDFTQFYERIMYNLGRRDKTPQFKRFSYIEKAEYWALVWGTVVMIITGIFLWFDNYFSLFLPKGFLDVSLVIHYWEAWLATLAIGVWHLYSTLFNPHVYPMNTSWITGKMPEEMYKQEHPLHVDEAKEEEEKLLKKEMESLSTSIKDLEDT
ncbi:MAG: cytochrome b/b6 domain-containing protein [Candidatus Neomarinimicrobiota bacterium]